MCSSLSFRLPGFVAAALFAAALASTAPGPAAAQEQTGQAPETSATDSGFQAPRGFIAQPTTPVNVGNPANSGPEQRVALVIGNSNYRNVMQLPNPANDARSIAQLLNTAGFEVIQATDLGHDEMIDVLRSFSAKIADKGPNTVAFVYYAGHGVQIDGDNYLIPVDANISDEDDVPSAGVRLVDVMATLQAVPSRMRIVVVDACRNNPFAGLREATRGLAIVDAPNGSIVGYSTAPGTEALDGQGSNSPYAGAFLKLARSPNVPIEQFFKNVRLEVNQETNGRQTPWESSSLTSNFTFFGDTVKIASQQPVREVYSSASMQTRGAREGYRYAMAADSVQGYRDFITFYPTDPYCDAIRSLLAAKLLALAWHETVLANSPVAYQTFYSRYPTSPYAHLALKLQSQPKMLPLYQPTNTFAPAHFVPQIKVTNLNQIGANGQGPFGHNPGNPALDNVLNKGGMPLFGNNQGQGNLGNSPVKTVAPGVDLAKQTDGGKPGIKIDPATTNNRVTTLPGVATRIDVKTNIATSNNGGISQPLGNKLKPGVLNANGSLNRGDRVVLNGGNTSRTNSGIVNNGTGQNFRPLAKVGTPSTMVMKTTANPSLQMRQPMMGQRSFGGGNSGGGLTMRSFH